MLNSLSESDGSVVAAVVLTATCVIASGRLGPPSSCLTFGTIASECWRCVRATGPRSPGNPQLVGSDIVSNTSMHASGWGIRGECGCHTADSKCRISESAEGFSSCVLTRCNVLHSQVHREDRAVPGRNLRLGVRAWLLPDSDALLPTMQRSDPIRCANWPRIASRGPSVVPVGVRNWVLSVVRWRVCPVHDHSMPHRTVQTDVHAD